MCNNFSFDYYYIFCGLSISKAYAEDMEFYSDEKYTDSDKLLNADGTESDKSIFEFSQEVKAAPAETAFSEITKVIPLQYLLSTQTNDCFTSPYLRAVSL